MNIYKEAALLSAFEDLRKGKSKTHFDKVLTLQGLAEEQFNMSANEDRFYRKTYLASKRDYRAFRPR